MEIALNQVSKRFNFNWIFKSVSMQISPSEPWVILGSNGSGKSTLLSIISGSALVSEGTVNWQISNQEVAETEVYRHVSIAAPYLDLIEDFTLSEHIDFHFSIKAPIGGLSSKDILGLTGLQKAKDKRISYFSSGMKQRLKLSLAILSDTPLLLLDEPLSNLDSKASEWYANLMNTYSKDRSIVVCSNHQEKEYFFCKHELNIEDFQK
ncbi:MAG: ATP-binding cassette domain-containing protein [Bacteroidia bacterium]